ncbi:hypothetical protein Ciccas_012157, partial [Cichlidogyrus casuarinus]
QVPDALKPTNLKILRTGDNKALLTWTEPNEQRPIVKYQVVSKLKKDPEDVSSRSYELEINFCQHIVLQVRAVFGNNPSDIGPLSDPFYYSSPPKATQLTASEIDVTVVSSGLLIYPAPTITQQCETAQWECVVILYETGNPNVFSKRSSEPCLVPIAFLDLDSTKDYVATVYALDKVSGVSTNEVSIDKLKAGPKTDELKAITIKKIEFTGTKVKLEIEEKDFNDDAFAWRAFNRYKKDKKVADIIVKDQAFEWDASVTCTHYTVYLETAKSKSLLRKPITVRIPGNLEVSPGTNEESKEILPPAYTSYVRPKLAKEDTNTLLICREKKVEVAVKDGQKTEYKTTTPDTLLVTPTKSDELTKEITIRCGGQANIINYGTIKKGQELAEKPSVPMVKFLTRSQIQIEWAKPMYVPDAGINIQGFYAELQWTDMKNVYWFSSENKATFEMGLIEHDFQTTISYSLRIFPKLTIKTETNIIGQPSDLVTFKGLEC